MEDLLNRKFGGFKSLVFLSILVSSSSYALQSTVTIYKLNADPAAHGLGQKIGTVIFEDSKKGLLIKPNLKGLSAGKHGMHIHENPSCEGGSKDGKYTPGLAAGSHLDPLKTQHHLGPYGEGHLGDLPVLEVNKSGRADKLMIAPRLSVKDIQGHSVMIHEGGDNYSDEPPMGGGGARIACGVIH